MKYHGHPEFVIFDDVMYFNFEVKDIDPKDFWKFIEENKFEEVESMGSEELFWTYVNKEERKIIELVFIEYSEGLCFEDAIDEIKLYILKKT